MRNNLGYKPWKLLVFNTFNIPQNQGTNIIFILLLWLLLLYYFYHHHHHHYNYRDKKNRRETKGGGGGGRWGLRDMRDSEHTTYTF